MKVVRIIARLNTGGPARHVTGLDQGLSSRGHDTLLVYGLLGPGEASLEHLVAESGIRAQQVPYLQRSLNPLRDLRAFVAILAILRRESPDVVHTHTAKAGTLGRLAAFVHNLTRGAGRRCLVVHTYHGHVLDGYFHPLVNRAIRATERLLARISDRIVTISPAQRRDIVERFAVAPAEKTVIVPLGLDLDALIRLPLARTAALAELRGIQPDDVVVGSVGRMVPIKDLATLVRAFARALAENSRLFLVMAGDGPSRAEVEALVRELGIEARVRFLGWIDDLPAFYASIDICMLTSLNEGTPVALIEAMAAGRPTIATAVGGVPDVVAHGATGVLARPRDVDALAKALVDLASNPRQRWQMGEAGRERAGTAYPRARLVTAIETLYEGALQRTRARDG